MFCISTDSALELTSRVWAHADTHSDDGSRRPTPVGGLVTLCRRRCSRLQLCGHRRHGVPGQQQGRVGGVVGHHGQPRLCHHGRALPARCARGGPPCVGREPHGVHDAGWDVKARGEASNPRSGPLAATPHASGQASRPESLTTSCRSEGASLTGSPSVTDACSSAPTSLRLQIQQLWSACKGLSGMVG